MEAVLPDRTEAKENGVERCHVVINGVLRSAVING